MLVAKLITRTVTQTDSQTRSSTLSAAAIRLATDNKDWQTEPQRSV